MKINRKRTFLAALLLVCIVLSACGNNAPTPVETPPAPRLSENSEEVYLLPEDTEIIGAARLESKLFMLGVRDETPVLACAWDFVSSLPDGLETQLGERGAGLSEGQIQRLAIARAILSPAPLMLLDEATSALDMANERAVLDNILGADRRRTVIVTTHRPTVLGECDRVYSIDDGSTRILEADEVERLLVHRTGDKNTV